ncbi:MbcA/ParS/Xre antitoxin family protein [Marinobacterium sedimentorum]|uniref:MbcA/ParS/Xre antitoxin family protein n=1 Tax=Marinobacterium sedimentorum TaxID=2927804 RepID=UPI0020C679FE|nr:MbcA/ParS/Xre antitoxin family protein [Marinobacterium sedimentorum]MCP8689329.1 MbcA/ParS/Xre antitoxin family protein [Marinobacterium sedimentorum]
MKQVVELRQQDPKRVSQVSLKVFFNIASAWHLSREQEQVLLGEPARSTFYKWRKGEGPVLPRDTLERISYVMGIYKALRILFPTEDQANAWPAKANAYFGGESALTVMLQGSLINLADVRRYLDHARG